MIRAILLIFLFIILSILSCLGAWTEEPWLILVSTITSALLGTAVSIAFEKIDFYGQGFKLWLQQIKYSKKDIRLSFSYLFKIEVNGKYLLVKGNRLKRQFQPIGGVYKYYPEAKSTLDEFHFRPDTRMNNHDETDDLRITIKGKYLLKYMKWFLSMKDREYDPHREFIEELIDTELLPKDLFKSLKYRKVSVHNKEITYSKYNQCDEFIYADIFELLLNYEQKEAVLSAVKKHPNELCLASDVELKSECYNGIDKNIGNNAKWIIGE